MALYASQELVQNLELRLKIITYAQAMTRHGGGFHPDIIAELWMTPIERFRYEKDIDLFRAVYAYVKWAAGEGPKPDWVQEDDIDKDW